MMTIDCVSGRELDDLTFFPNEHEVVFRPYTTFYINKKTINKDVIEIELKEAHPDIRGRKVLVWVDDVRGSECHQIMDNSEKNGVTCVHLHSTEAANDFFIRQSLLLKRSTDNFRIITDMVRNEKGKKNIEAGLHLAKSLQKLGYTQGILCFTGPEYLKANQKKFNDAGLPHVYATCLRQDAELYAKFNGLPGTLPKYSTSTIQLPLDSTSGSSVETSTV